MLLILFCYKVFVHRKIKITQFPDGLHLNLNLILFAFVKGLHVVARWLTWTLAHKKARELKKILGCLPTKPISPRQLDPFFKPWAQPYNFFRKCSSVDSKIYPENSGILSLFLPYLIIGTGVTNSSFFVSALATAGWVCFCKIFTDKHLVHRMHAQKSLCTCLKYINFFTYKYRNHRFGSLIKEFRAWTNILQKQ